MLVGRILSKLRIYYLFLNFYVLYTLNYLSRLWFGSKIFGASLSVSGGVKGVSNFDLGFNFELM